MPRSNTTGSEVSDALGVSVGIAPNRGSNAPRSDRRVVSRSDDDASVKSCAWGLCDGDGIYYEEISYRDPQSLMLHTHDIIEKVCPCSIDES